MSPRPKAVTDEQLFRAVARAIGRVGPAELTLGHVAAEAGISAPSIVQRFGSKRDLLLAFAAQAGSELGARFAAAREAHRSPRAALRAALASLTAGMRGTRAIANNIAFLQLDVADDAFRAHAREFARALRAEIGALLDAAVAAGELRPGTDCVRLAAAIHVAYNGALITWAVEREGALGDALLEAVDFVLAAA